MQSAKVLVTVAGRCGARQKQHWDRASQEGKFGISAVGNGEHGGWMELSLRMSLPGLWRWRLRRGCGRRQRRVCESLL